MAEIKDAGKVAVRAIAPKGAEIGKPGAIEKDPGAIMLPDDIRIDKRIRLTPEAQARFQLADAEKRVDKELAALDKAIAERTAGGSLMKHFNDPVLADLRAARAELQKAKADLQAARKDLSGRLPMLELAQNYMGPIKCHPAPDLAAAEARINSALGHLDKSSYLVDQASDKLPPEPVFFKGGAPVWRGNSLRTQLADLQRDLGSTHRLIEDARQNVWEAQEQGPTRPWPPRDFPPYYLKDAIPAKEQ